MTLPDIDTFQTYGGPLKNYHDVEDPTTDLDADAGNKALCNVAMMTHTAPRAFCAIVTAGTGAPTDPTSYVHDAMWGSAVAVKPTPARTGVGVHTITWPATVSDEGTVYGQAAATHTLAIRHAWVAVEGSTYVRAQCAVTAANVVTVYTFDSSGTALDTTGAHLCVFIV